MNLRVRNASFAYRLSEPILRNVSFEAHPGDLIAVLGPNGAGKTTLMRCLLGTLKWNSGESTIDDQYIRSLEGQKLLRRIAYVPQSRGAVSSLTAADMILLGCTSHLNTFSIPTEDDREHVKQIAEQLHIAYLLDKRCNQISGGELQMVLIARALAAEPELMILDEPESNLDFKNQLIVLDTLYDLAAKDICCLFNTHYPEHALAYANKTLLLEKDGNSLFGETASILTRENIAKIFGVRTVIGEVETETRIYQNIFPIEILQGTSDVLSEDHEEDVIAVISMIFSEEALSERINGILHEYSRYIIGRMGLPYNKEGLFIINITLDAARLEVKNLTHKLNLLKGMSIKTTVWIKSSRKEAE